MKQRNELRKLVLASSFVAISIVINIFFKQILGMRNFGVPFYAIPLVYGSIILGPIYGIIMGLVSDWVGFVIAPSGDFSLLFSLSSMVWGFVPGLFLYKKYNRVKLFVLVAITHVLATLANTIGLLFLLPVETALATLPYRIVLIPINVVIMGHSIHQLVIKLSTLAGEITLKPAQDYQLEQIANKP